MSNQPSTATDSFFLWPPKHPCMKNRICHDFIVQRFKITHISERKGFDNHAVEIDFTLDKKKASIYMARIPSFIPIEQDSFQ